MKNFVQYDDILTLTAPSGGVVSGKAYLIGSLLAVAQVTKSAGDTFTAAVEGVVTLDKATGAAWTEGAKLYWDNTNKNVTTTATSNTFIGYAAAAAASGDTSGNVLLRQAGV